MIRGVPPRVASAPISLSLHGDVLDPWCWIVERRVVFAAEELHGRFMPLVHVPLPKRWEARAPSAAERRQRARDLRRAAQEPDAPPFSPELWSGSAAGPVSSAPALIAVAAAALQGRAVASALREALREAALLRGLDVSRPDIVLEVAARAGVDLARFVPACAAPGTERALLDEVEEAAENGIETGPALVIGDDWMVAGVRSLRDYRVVLKQYLAARVGTHVEHTVH
jgi:predicted DsbA family dithiol-disulfide isomerase